MPDALTAIGAIGAGASCGAAVMAIAGRSERMDAARWLARRRPIRALSVEEPLGAWTRTVVVAGLHTRLRRLMDRAGWKESPERLTAIAFALSSCIAVLAVASSSAWHLGGAAILGVLGFGSGIGSCVLVLRSAVARRRRRLAAELVPLLELLALELNGGGSALSALASVTAKVQGELAFDLRRLLIASQVAGSAPFEMRLMNHSENLDLPALASLATILGASREYGTGVVHGVRALATDLRNVQRRELVAHSRRALNHVLIPAAVGVLLPFLAVVMFPAVTTLQRSLH